MPTPVSVLYCRLIAGALASALCVSLAPALAEAGCSKSVIMYNASWCGYCKQVRTILARNQISYTTLDATTPDVQAIMRKRFGDTAVPRTVIGGVVVEGVDETRIKLLCRPREPKPADRRHAAGFSSTSTCRGKTACGAGNPVPGLSLPLGRSAAKSRTSFDTPS